jgi:hypothetical protein
MSAWVLGFRPLKVKAVRFSRDTPIAPAADVRTCLRSGPRPSPASGNLRPLRVDDDREVLHGGLDQLLGAVAGGGVEEQGVAGLHQVGAVGVPVAHLAGQHVEELDAGVSEARVGRGVLAQRDEVGLDAEVAGQRVAEQVVEMAGLGAAPPERAFTITVEQRAPNEEELVMWCSQG